MNDTRMADPHAFRGDDLDPSAVCSTLPPELVVATACEAARDADRVIRFLHELGLVPSPERPLRLPAASLLNLAAALRLLGWELDGLHLHRDVGLPPAEQALRDAFQSLVEPVGVESRASQDLSSRVLALFIESFAWHGRRELDADVALDRCDEDAMLDALAEFLWALRHAGRASIDTGSPR